MARFRPAGHPRLRYAEGVRSATRLDQADVCLTCGMPYLIANGHNCPGPRAALTPRTQIGSSRYLTPRRAMDIPTEPRDWSIRMATVAADHPARTDDAPTLDGLRVSHMAATLIRKGHTSESVRDYAAGRQQFAYMWLAIANAMDDAIIAESVPAQRAAPTREAAPA